MEFETMTEETPEIVEGPGAESENQTEYEPGTQPENNPDTHTEIENGSNSEIFTSPETETDSGVIESSEIADSSETETAAETETAGSSEIADSSETETATGTETVTGTGGTLTIPDDNPHDDESGGTAVDTHIQEMLASINEQLGSDRERMLEGHEELMEAVNSINTAATLGTGILLCILLCTGALFGAYLAKTFWERLRN